MLFFNKFLPFFVLPLGLAGWLVLFAWWRKKRWPVALAVLLLYASSIPFVGNRLMHWLEGRNPPVALAEVEAAEAVVVLGGILGPKMPPGFLPNFTDTSERFDGGLALLAAGKANALVFTGARMGWLDSPASEGDELKRIAITRGVAPEKILVTAHVLNTADEAAALNELMRAQHWRRVILVTSAWHLPRAGYQFKRAGVNCVLFPVDFRGDTQHKLTVLDFLPRGDAWLMTNLALRETYGLWFYRIFG